MEQRRIAKKADSRIAAVSGIGIVLVVFGHSQIGSPRDWEPGFDTPYSVWVLVGKWISTFHMPLFFALSGYLLLHATLRGGERPYPAFATLLRERAKRLLLPYVVISSLVLPIKAAMSRHAQRPVELSWSAWAESTFIPWQNVIVYFWFLPTLFLMFVAAPGLFDVRRTAWRKDLLILALAVGAHFTFPHKNTEGVGSVLNVFGALSDLVYFQLGFLIRKYATRPPRHGSVLCAALFAVTWLLYLLLPQNVGTEFIEAMCGSVMVAEFVLCSPRLHPTLARIGDYSFQIYLLSWFAQTPLKVIAGRIHFLPEVALALVSVMLGVALPMLIASAAMRLIPRRYLAPIGI